MIEIQELKFGNSGNRPWRAMIRTDMPPIPDDFDNVLFRIDGVVYTKWSEEFEDAFKAVMMWGKLKYD